MERKHLFEVGHPTSRTFRLRNSLNPFLPTCATHMKLRGLSLRVAPNTDKQHRRSPVAGVLFFDVLALVAAHFFPHGRSDASIVTEVS